MAEDEGKQLLLVGGTCKWCGQHATRMMSHIGEPGVTHYACANGHEWEYVVDCRDDVYRIPSRGPSLAELLKPLREAHDA